MDQYAGRLLADRYRLPKTPSEEFELVESRAFDTASGQEVLVRQVPLPEVVDAETLDEDGRGTPQRHSGRPRDRATRFPEDPVVRRAVAAAVAASKLPDHPRLDQVFDVFVQGDGLWIVSELVHARPLAAVLAEERLGPYRAAEIAADLLAALRIVHAHGWVHRNVTARTVLICDDGRAVLTGLAVGACEEVLCGYDPLPEGMDEDLAALPPETAASERPGAAAPPRSGWDRPSGPTGPAGPTGPVEAGPAAGTAPRAGRAGPGPAAGGATEWWESVTRPYPGGPPTEGPRQGHGPVPGEGPGAGPEGDRRQGPPARTGQPWGAEAAGRADRRSLPARADHGGVTARLPVQQPPEPGPGGRPTAGENPHGPGPEAYRRWESGPRAPEAGSGQAGAAPHGGQALPSAWDFEGGAYAAGGPAGWGRGGPQGGPAPQAPRATSPSGDPPGPAQASPGQGGFGPYSGQRPGPGQAPGAAADAGPGTASLPRVSGQPRAGSAADRAARSGAIAAYRAGTQAGAAARGRTHQGTPGVSPTELPGSPRPSHPVRTGWEPPPKQQRPLPAQQTGVPEAAPAAPGPNSPSPQGPTSPRPSASPQGPGASQLPGPRQPAGAAAPQPGQGTARPRARAGTGRYRGPDSALAAERARQARIMTVGAVTERWAPELAGPVYEHWRLAPPVGPAADFWALGALLFRAVQGYPPYPEDSAEELTQAVCAEQPAFAEDCGALRPIIESLLRQDPTERPSAEELRGWLRSLLRSAPEPEVGRHTVTAPAALEPGRPADPRRLPMLRRRGELVGPRRRLRARGQRNPRRLGRVLLTLVLLGLAGAIAYVLAFMSDAEQDAGSRAEGAAAAGAGEADSPSPSTSPQASPSEEDTRQPSPEGRQQPAPPPEGYLPQEDEAGFSLTVPEGFERQGPNDAGQVVYTDGEVEIVVVPGRDDAEQFGAEPMEYQLGAEPELQAFRDYQYATSSGLYETQVGNTVMAEGVFGWQENGSERLACNRVMLLDGQFHVVLVRGPAAEEQRITEIYEVTAESYRWRP